MSGHGNNRQDASIKEIYHISAKRFFIDKQMLYTVTVAPISVFSDHNDLINILKDDPFVFVRIYNDSMRFIG